MKSGNMHMYMLVVLLAIKQGDPDYFYLLTYLRKV